MDTEIFTFGPLEPEKMGFKDSKPTFEIMTKTALLWSEFFAVLGDWLLCIFFTLVKVNENLSTSMRISILKFVVMEDSKTKIWLAIPGIGFEVLQMRIQFNCCHLDLFQMLIIVDWLPNCYFSDKLLNARMMQNCIEKIQVGGWPPFNFCKKKA